MPLLPRGLGRDLLERVKERIKREVGLGAPVPKPPARTTSERLMRIREAVSAEPPFLLRALYQAVDAAGPTWRELEPYELVYNNPDDPATPNLYAACEKEGWKIELFRLSRFHDIQLTQKTFAPRWPLVIRTQL